MAAKKRTIEIFLLSITLASQVYAEQVGELVEHDRIAGMNVNTGAALSCPDSAGPGDKDAACPLRALASPVNIGDQMQTDDGGRARVFLYDERFPTTRRQFELLNSTTVKILKNGLKISPIGKVRWVGEGGTVELPKKRSVQATSTSFIVSHDADGVTKVIALSDGVEVTDGEQDARETLRKGDCLLMEPGLAPRFLERLVSADLARASDPFLFIGSGRAESQTVRNRLLSGDEVPIPDRAPLPAPRWKDDDRLWPEQPVAIDLLVDF